MSRRGNVIRVLISTALVAAAGFAVAPGQATAGTACTGRTLSQPLRSWGDTHNYFLASGADFELGQGWTRSGGAFLQLENEPWRVASPTHVRSVALPPGGQVAHAGICLRTNEETLRFFWKSPGRQAVLTVRIAVPGSGTNTATYSGMNPGWNLSPMITLPAVASPAGQYATISIRNAGASGTWLVDDILIDPRARGCC